MESRASFYRSTTQRNEAATVVLPRDRLRRALYAICLLALVYVLRLLSSASAPPPASLSAPSSALVSLPASLQGRMEYIAGNLVELQSRVKAFEQHAQRSDLAERLVNGFADVPEWEVAEALQLDKATSSKFKRVRLSESVRDFFRLETADISDLFSVYGAMTLYQFKQPNTTISLIATRPFFFSVAVFGLPKVT